MAQKKTTKKVEDHTAQNIGIGVGLTTAAVAAAGAYFLYGSKSAAKNRKTVKSWALKAKAEVLEKLEDAQQMTQEEYEALIKSVTATYAGVKNATKSDLSEFTKEMRDHWKSIEKAAAPLKKSAKKEAKTAAKNVAKTAASTAAVKAVKKVTKPAKKAAKKATKKTTK